MFRRFLCAAVLAIAPIAAGAQTMAGVSPVYRRAQAMVNDGNAAAGRALIDSMIAVAVPGSNENAEGVFWRAVLAATAAEAEMDYRRVVVDYPLSPRVDDALIRLAQLEIARGNYDGALRHLNRLVMEHPQSPSRGRAGYWAARAMFDKNDIQGACAATADALARTPEDDAELRNQITYLNQRCAGVVLSVPTAPATVGSATGAGVISSPVVTKVDSVASIVTAPVSPPPVVVRTDSAKARVIVPTESVRPPPAETPVRQRDTAATPARRPAVTAPPAAGGTASAFSVQVAAYNVKSQADAMAAKLRKGGYEARVDGRAAPFRVRIGRYATRAQASAVQRSLKAKLITGIVVQVDPP